MEYEVCSSFLKMCVWIIWDLKLKFLIELQISQCLPVQGAQPARVQRLLPFAEIENRRLRDLQMHNDAPGKGLILKGMVDEDGQDSVSGRRCHGQRAVMWREGGRAWNGAPLAGMCEGRDADT